ncbi:MAG: PEP-CTERM sorting domain-containing protein [Pirellulales bacterium]|nr:PEP-CTERM sorting domain-containing protein [Pirellulales bacterium]
MSPLRGLVSFDVECPWVSPTASRCGRCAANDIRRLTSAQTIGPPSPSLQRCVETNGLRGIDGNKIVGYYRDTFTQLDISFIYTIPEPSTWLLGLIGAASLGALVRRGRKHCRDSRRAHHNDTTARREIL